MSNIHETGITYASGTYATNQISEIKLCENEVEDVLKVISHKNKPKMN
jgi:hypothetical protein